MNERDDESPDLDRDYGYCNEHNCRAFRRLRKLTEALVTAYADDLLIELKFVPRRPGD